ncbi:hypothetical protein [Thermus sp.]
MCLIAGLALLADPGLARGEWRAWTVEPEASGGFIGGQVTGVAFGAGVFVATALSASWSPGTRGGGR